MSTDHAVQVEEARDAGYQAALDDVLRAVASLRGDVGVARLVSRRRGEFRNTTQDDDWMQDFTSEEDQA